MNTWNKRLEVALKSRNRKQTDLAKFVGVSTATTSDWINGVITKISAENSLKVCKFLNISPDWLMFGEGEMDFITLTIDDYKAINLSRSLGVKERATWYRVGSGLTEPPENLKDIK